MFFIMETQLIDCFRCGLEPRRGREEVLFSFQPGMEGGSFKPNVSKMDLRNVHRFYCT
jgi:hypothetical protein